MSSGDTEYCRVGIIQTSGDTEMQFPMVTMVTIVVLLLLENVHYIIALVFNSLKFINLLALYLLQHTYMGRI